MPQFLQNPAHTKIIRQFGRRSPVQDPLIILLGTGADAFSTNGELSTADIPNLGRDLVCGYIEDFLVCVCKICANVVGLDIGVGWTEGEDACGTPWIVFAAQVDVPVGVN